MNRRITALCLALGLLALAAASCEDRRIGQGASKEEISKTIRENPQIVFEVLDKDKEMLVRIVQQGIEQLNKKAQREQRLAQLKDPKKPTFDADRPFRGPKDGPIQIVEYSDFECPYCSQAARTVELAMSQYEGKVRLQFKHMPLPRHKNALIAAKYFEAAGMQSADKAWKFYDVLFQKQEELEKRGEEFIKEVAAGLGFDMAKLAADAQSELVVKRITADLEEAEALGLNGTPMFLVNGVVIAGAQPLPVFNEVIELVLEHAKKPAEPVPAPGK